MQETYGDYWDRTDEIRELCFNCKYPDCFGDDGCPERRAIVARMKEQEQGDKSRRLVGTQVEIDGDRRSLADWCRIYGVKYQTAWQRIKKGMEPEEAIKGITSRGGARNYGQMIKIGDQKRGITEWLRMYRIDWKTVNRYTRKHGCSREEAVRALCEKKRARFSI